MKTYKDKIKYLDASIRGKNLKDNINSTLSVERSTPQVGPLVGPLVIFKILFLVIACLYISGCTVTKTKVTNIPYHSKVKAISSIQEAEKLEENLKNAPNNLAIRTQLLIFYNNLSELDNLEKRQYKHILWIIKNRPKSKIASSYNVSLDPIIDGQTYEKGKQLWLQNIQKFNKNEVVINNAAEYLLSFDRDIAKELLQKGKKLSPSSPKWALKLAHLYYMDTIVGNPNSGKKALTELELAYSLTQNPLSKYYMLTDLAQYAYVAKEKKKAKQYALQLLDQSKQYSKDWNYGNSIHMGNQVLGKLAFENGNIEDAKKYLIASGKTPGSPQLGSFGPYMILAKQLLDKGEKEAVIEYLKLCSSFWTMGKDDLKIWIKGIKQDETPDFDRSLIF